jgi:hypothetical protein
MTEFTWKVGDWAVFDRDIVQIKEIRETGGCEVSEGTFSTFGMLIDRLRPLTLRNKRTIEYFDYYYRQLSKLRGERGFNYPDISRHFSQLALNAMDGDEKDDAPFEAAREFVRRARDYEPMIDGIHLFRD